MIKVLFLAANPLTKTTLALDEEIRAIDAALHGARHCKRFKLLQHWAVHLEDLSGLLLRHEPQIVQFSGHGEKSGALALVADGGQAKEVPPEALAGLFRVLRDNVRLVVLNACYSEAQAQAIVQEIDCAVGTTDEITDDHAIAFAAEFYRAVAAGRSVQKAFDLALVRLVGEGVANANQLVRLLKRPGVKPDEIVLATTPAHRPRKPASAVPLRPRQHLRWRAVHFTGRDDEVAGLAGEMRSACRNGTASSFVGLRGMGGIGKTALAAELAERLDRDAGLFPGGVLWANLLDKAPEDVARDFVRDLGGDPAGLGPEQCLARFHDLAADRRPLVVLDNVPRSPGSEGPAAKLVVRARGAATLLTTRFRDAVPPGVPVREVGALQPPEALALLRVHVGAAVEADGPSAGTIVERCGCLPLFLNAAGRAVGNGYYTLAEYAAELRRRGLSALADEDEQAAGVFELSWRFVSEPAREVFVALALAPGEDVGPNLVAAWLRQGGGGGQRPERLLAELANATLLLPADERARRYRYHDRARDYAVSKLARPREDVRCRLLSSYAEWDFVRAEFDAVGAFGLAGQYHQLHGWGATKPAGFAAWCHFVRGQASVLASYPDLFFQQALNEPEDSPVSRAARERAGSGEAPGLWLEWVNRPRQFAPSACILALAGHSAEVTSVAVTRDGCTAVSGSRDSTVRAWDLATGQCRTTLSGHTDAVTSVAVSADGGTALSGAEDDTVRVWDLASGRCRTTLTGHGNWVNGVALSADGHTAVSGAGDGTVRVWDLITGRCRATLEGHVHTVNGVALSADGRTAVSGAEDETVRVWDLATGQCRAVLSGHTGAVNGAALTADGCTAVSGGMDRTVRVWDLAAGGCRAVLSGHAKPVFSVAVLADSRTAVSGAGDGTLRLWDLTAAECRATLTGHAGAVHAVAVSADGRTAVSGGQDETVRVWELTGAEGRPTGEGNMDLVLGIAVAADGRTVVSGGGDETVRVWDLATGQCRATLTGHTGWVRAVAVSADGRTAVSGADDTTVRLWDLAARECRATLEGHTYGVTRVALSADAAVAVSGSHDGSVRVWDLAAGGCRAVHPQESGDARRAWASVGALGALSARGNDRFLEVRAAGAEAALARFPGRFTVANCSPDGRHVAAVDARGVVYLLRLDSPTG
jgi:WD40 repeat protein